MTERNWTKAQEKAIHYKEGNLLVAAGAGSGKTAVLVERVISYLTDEENPLEIDRLLVVTFTNAAAAEMRQRIAEALEQKLAAAKDPAWLKKQLALLPRASISTLHAFCLDLVRQFFYRLDIDPRVRVANPMEIAMLKEDAMEAAFQERYDAEDNELRLLLDAFGNGPWDDRLRDEIKRFDDFSRSLPDPENWLQSLAEPYEEAAKISDDSGEALAPAWLAMLLEEIRRELNNGVIALEAALDCCRKPGGPELYAECIQTELNGVLCLKQAANWQELSRLMADFAFSPRLPAIKKSDIVDEQIKEMVKSFRDDAKKALKTIKETYFALPLEAELAKIAAMAPVARALVQMTLDYQARLSEMKKVKRLLDFQDMEHFCLKLLRQEDGQVKSALQEQYQAVLVDEYQDINQVQEEIIQEVAAVNSFFMVGDIKQSIYRFRLADPGLFQQKFLAYGRKEGGIRIDLQKNFRSRPSLLHGINFIFSQIMSAEGAEIAYDDAARLLPGREETEPQAIALYILPDSLPQEDSSEETAEAGNENGKNEGNGNGSDAGAEEGEREDLAASAKEARFIGEKILALYNEGYQYRDMVILLRNIKNVAPLFQEELTKMGIPCHGSGGNTFYEAAEVSVMLSLLQVIDNPRQDIHLATVLHSPIGGFSMEDLAALRLEAPGDLYEALLASDDLKAVSFCANLTKWQEPGQSNRISLLLGQLYQETGFFQLAGALPEGGQRQANLLFLLEQAKEYEKTSYRGLFGFLKFIQRHIASGQGGENAKTLGENENVVRIISIHQSKGLEFPVVFLAGLSKNFNITDCREDILLHREFGLGLRWINLESRIKSESLLHLALSEKIYWELIAEEMRLFYVAMTRAKEKLILVGSVKNLPATMKKCAGTLAFSNRVLPGYLLSKGANYLTWTIRALLRHPHCGALRQLLPGGDDESYVILPQEGSFAVTLGMPRPLEPCREALTPQWLNQVAQGLPLYAEPPQNSLTEALEWHYPWLEAAKTAVKWTATGLQKTETEPEALPAAVSTTAETSYRQSRVMERGIVVHKLLELIDFRQQNPLVALQSQLKALVDEGSCSAALAAEIDLAMLTDFICGPLGQRAKASPELYRELAFTLLQPAVIVNSTLREEDILVQGTIDLVFWQEDGWVLVDYKLSRSHGGTKQELTAEVQKRYGWQLTCYRRALEAIWQKPVKECHVYFLPDRQDVKVFLPN